MPVGVYLAVLFRRRHRCADAAHHPPGRAPRLGRRAGRPAQARREHRPHRRRTPLPPLPRPPSSASWCPRTTPWNPRLQASALAVIWVMGFVDDWWSSRPGPVPGDGRRRRDRHRVQGVRRGNNPFTDRRSGGLVHHGAPTIWLSGMTSTVDLVDGLNGLAAGVTGISALVLFVHMLRLGQYSVAVLPGSWAAAWAFSPTTMAGRASSGGGARWALPWRRSPS